MGSVVSKTSRSCTYSQIQPGDMIEIQVHRTYGAYSHWALCESVNSLGIVWCVHVIPVGVDREGKGRATVRYEPLEDILMVLSGMGTGIAPKYRVNNQQKLAQKVLKVAKSPKTLGFHDVNRHRVRDLDFNPLTCNSEHYCTHWRYGIGWSTQVMSSRQVLHSVVKHSAFVI